jgi:hypothetical protein
MKLIVFCLFLLAHVASASVIYSFTGNSDIGPPVPPGPFTFTLTTPSFIVSDLTNIIPGPTLTCNLCDSISMLPSHPGTATDSRQIAYTFSGNAGSLEFYFPPGAFTAPGVYSSFLISVNEGTLTVTAAVPEAGTFNLYMLGLGTLLLSSLRRSDRRKNVRQQRRPLPHGRGSD